MANPNNVLPDFYTNPENPFFLHPSENPGLVLVSPPLDERNYHSWATSMTMALLSKNKIGFINGTLPPPPPPELDPSFHAWQRCNMIVLSWIQRSISSSIAKSILWIDRASDAWADLRGRFSHSDIFRISDLQEDMYRMQQGDRDRDQVVRFLKGLNEQYAHPVRSQVMLMDPFPNLIRVFSLIVQQERQMHSGLLVEENGDTKAFHSCSDNQQLGVGRGHTTPEYMNKGRGPSKMCTCCGRPHHTIDTCYQKHGFPPGFKSRVPKANFVAHYDTGNDIGVVEEVDNQDGMMTITHEEY
ncbi:uncharacterized protein LOC133287708 [Gastrolobium bilobum]|uniref:uncharacterized protein LOC133287708 n=1 Tax=Gastrolobium bilobum TaxID=150636 RepID=UPI002AB32296|nr:uncharacterized protein LOC133287708 [Gastrolobium bilobum]